MRAKACTRCRQWKTGCDADVSGPEGCSRCREQGLQCVFDKTFQRIPRRRKLAADQNGLNETTATTTISKANTAAGIGPEILCHNEPTSALGSASLTPQSLVDSNPWPINTIREGDPLSEPDTVLQGLCLTDKFIGNIHLSAARANDLFRIYFTRCHGHVPFVISRSIESIYERCPLLFWVICAVSSLEAQRTEIQAHIQEMISDILCPPKGNNVETVQALLILCIWPYPLTEQGTNSSFIHSSLAVQISLTIGLHRPAVDADFGIEVEEGRQDEDIRRSTWLACFVIAQIEASRRGVPATVQADYSLLCSLDSPIVPPDLSRLCRISHITIEFTQAIGARGANSAGLAEPVSRIGLINGFAKQMDSLRHHFPQPSDVVAIFFLGAKLQLWSFALHNDIPASAEVVQILQRAKGEAVKLIQVACEKNLSLVPYYTRRSVCFAALFLYRMRWGPYQWQDDMIDHYIETARHSLIASELRMGHFLTIVTAPENRDAFIRVCCGKRSPHRSRMGAFMMLDFLQVYKEIQESSLGFPTGFFDFDNLLWIESQ